MSVAAVLLALMPAAAAAQSAGDEQYEDPFPDEQAQATPTATPAPAAPAQATATPAPAQPEAAPTAVAPAPAAAQLPRSGADAALPALLGVILLAAGMALRVRVRQAP